VFFVIGLLLLAQSDVSRQPHSGATVAEAEFTSFSGYFITLLLLRYKFSVESNMAATAGLNFRQKEFSPDLSNVSNHEGGRHIGYQESNRHIIIYGNIIVDFKNNETVNRKNAKYARNKHGNRFLCTMHTCKWLVM